MIIGTPKEIKDNEYRVGITPGGVRQLAQAGHQVFVETGAGEGSGFSDEEYETSRAKIVSTSAEVLLGSNLYRCC
jgi:alanine dehydrogenase